jgi:predicted RNA-binding protein with TRAM domain
MHARHAVHKPEITGLTRGPHGVGRLDRKVIFVRGVVKGEQVEVSVREDRGSFAYADLHAVLRSAPERRVRPVRICRTVAVGVGVAVIIQAAPVALTACPGFAASSLGNQLPVPLGIDSRDRKSQPTRKGGLSRAECYV